MINFNKSKDEYLFNSLLQIFTDFFMNNFELIKKNKNEEGKKIQKRLFQKLDALIKNNQKVKNEYEDCSELIIILLENLNKDLNEVILYLDLFLI